DLPSNRRAPAGVRQLGNQVHGPGHRTLPPVPGGQSVVTTDAQRQALRHAAQWFAQLCANPEDAALRAQWQRWHCRRAEHEWAWQQLTELQARLGGMPQHLAWNVMEKSTLRESG